MQILWLFFCVVLCVLCGKITARIAKVTQRTHVTQSIQCSVVSIQPGNQNNSTIKQLNILYQAYSPPQGDCFFFFFFNCLLNRSCYDRAPFLQSPVPRNVRRRLSHWGFLRGTVFAYPQERQEVSTTGLRSWRETYTDLETRVLYPTTICATWLPYPANCRMDLIGSMLYLDLVFINTYLIFSLLYVYVIKISSFLSRMMAG